MFQKWFDIFAWCYIVCVRMTSQNYPAAMLKDE